MRCASSAVHSMRCVGLLMGMMMGCSLISPISRSTPSVNSRPAPDSPISPVGLPCSPSKALVAGQCRCHCGQASKARYQKACYHSPLV